MRTATARGVLLVALGDGELPAWAPRPGARVLGISSSPAKRDIALADGACGAPMAEPGSATTM